MDLTERQLQILEAIINDYVENAEPVGSRSIAKKYNLGVSPATIRNEMSDLEEMGYLTHPHTSAGRVPSDKAYRLYVNTLMKKKNLSAREKKLISDRLAESRNEFDATIRHAAQLLSEITQLASFAMTPATNEETISFIRLLPVDERTLILMIVGDTGNVTNTTLRLTVPYTQEALDLLSKNMTVTYKGRTLDDVLKSEIIREAGSDIEAMSSLQGTVMPSFIRTLEEMLNVNLYMEGMTNIFNLPEFASIDRARAFLEIFTRKDEFARKMLERADGVVVTIGDENDSMKDCTLITATYHVDGRLVGKIGVIGPTRMRYDEVTAIIEYLTSNLSECFRITNGSGACVQLCEGTSDGPHGGDEDESEGDEE
ncbi:MAG: heat-inducible transcription repressor HrcA [Mogibacterium sp.]|nr:heat-inducible transcription repressor HrcA [Mogibacterium sp.]